MMRTVLLITGYLVMTSIGALALGVMLCLVRELGEWHTDRHYRKREHTAKCDGTQPHRSPSRARVGRPPRSQVFPEQWTTTESLALLLTYSGRLLLAAERERQS